MDNNKKQEAENDQKVQTRYDKKMEARRLQEIKDKRNAKVMKAGALVVCIGIVAAITFSVVVSVLNKNEVTKDVYVKIGEHQLTKLEYEYYYRTAVNNSASNLSYMGVDVNSDFSSIPISETMTMKDMFDQTAVEQAKQTKILVDDAAANQFTYDTAQEYQSFLDNIATAAKTAGVSVSEFYKNNYGSYATQKNMEPIIKEGITATAYYQDLITKNAPTDAEIKTNYEENKLSYDKVDYRSFAFKTELAEDATQEEIDKAMQDMNTKAEAMMEERKAGADFEELCITNASQEDKANYEDEATQYSLSEGQYSYATPSAVTSWLYEDGRVAGDITVVKDDTTKQVFVVEFVNKYFDEADNTNISNTIASGRVSEYVSGLAQNYEVTDVKGELVYLTIEEPAQTDEGVSQSPDTEAATGDTEDTPAEGGDEAAVSETDPAEETSTEAETQNN